MLKLQVAISVKSLSFASRKTFRVARLCEQVSVFVDIKLLFDETVVIEVFETLTVEVNDGLL